MKSFQGILKFQNFYLLEDAKIWTSDKDKLVPDNAIFSVPEVFQTN